MKFSISKKIILIAVSGVIASSIIILVLGSSMTGRLFNNSLYNDMHAMQALVENMVNDEESRLRQTVRILVTMPQFIDAVYNDDRDKVKESAVMFMKQFEYDVVTVTDEHGIVLARGHSEREADDISTRPMIAAALGGNISSGVYYDSAAEVPFSIRSFSPIYKDDIFIGVLSIGTNVASETYADHIHKITNMNFSIFYGDTRFMTSFADENGNRIIGTVHDYAHITDNVLIAGETVIDRYDILGEPNMVALWPVIEADSNRIIGMWGIAMSITEQIRGMNTMMMIITLCSLGIMIIIAVAAGFLGNKIAVPISKTTDYAMQVSAGNLDYPLDLPLEGHNSDEIGFLIGAIRTMISSLKERISETEGLNERVLSEVEETKRLMNEIVRQRMEAEKANKAKSYFLSTMSHEIRTPMNAVLGITEINLMNESLDTNIKTDFEKIYNAGYLLLGIINDILDLSKIEAGKLELSINKYDVASMLSDTVQLNMLRIGSKLIEFELDVDEKMPVTLSGDGLRIRQILNNLLSNAFKYTEEGFVKMSVSTDCIDEQDNDRILLKVIVSDTGRGMTKEQVAGIFDDYARFHVEREQVVEGTGLGMSITNNLINLMDGEIFVESEPNKGSVFTIRIPQNKTGSEILGKEMAENLRLFRTTNRAGIRRAQIIFEPMPYGSVLIVDDADANIYVAKGLLAPYELNIESVDRGLAAIEKVKEGNIYDIIFMDHMMPDMDGIEATRLIREFGYTDPIIALTANAVSGQVDMFLNNGFNDFISKPIDIRHMNVILNRYIRDKQPEEVLAAVRRYGEKKKNNQTKDSSNHEFNTGIYPDFSEIKIDGLDIDRGIERYHGNFEAYIKVLHSYSVSVREMLRSVGTTGFDDLINYKIKVHGIKGASYDVFADVIANRFEALEKAAGSGDIDYLKLNNIPSIDALNDLLDRTDMFLSEVKHGETDKNFKPIKDKIDTGFITELINACNGYDMSGVDKVMDKIEEYEYKTDKELSAWLRENVDLINFAEITERLTQEQGSN